jgi:hypothetical protein
VKHWAQGRNSAIDMATAMGIELLTEEQYRELQKLGNFDTKTSSWVKTPPAIRKLGGALFCDRRYDAVFVYHKRCRILLCRQRVPPIAQDLGTPISPNLTVGESLFLGPRFGDFGIAQADPRLPGLQAHSPCDGPLSAHLCATLTLARRKGGGFGMTSAALGVNLALPDSSIKLDMSSVAVASKSRFPRLRLLASRAGTPLRGVCRLRHFGFHEPEAQNGQTVTAQTPASPNAGARRALTIRGGGWNRT